MTDLNGSTIYDPDTWPSLSDLACSGCGSMGPCRCPSSGYVPRRTPDETKAVTE